MSVQMLAISTSTTLCSVALLYKGNIYDSSFFSPRCHSEKILPMIHQLLVDSGITLQDLNCIIFDKGPGSFVGVRVGISVAQGLSLGSSNIPLMSVSSLEVLAQGSMRLFFSRKVIAVMDAGMGKLYWAHYFYQKSHRVWLCKRKADIITDNVEAQKLICSLQGKWVLVGTGWNNYSSLQYVRDNDPILFRSIMLPSAIDMVSIGLYRWENKLFCTPNQINPMYIHKKIATKNLCK